MSAQVITKEETSAKPYGKALDYISASRLTCWQQCRRKFYFRYVAELPSPSSPALHLGKVVHATLQKWNLWRWEKSEHKREELRQVLDDSWDRELQENPVAWKDGKQALDTREQAWALIETYLDEGVIDEAESIAGVEVRLDAELDGLPPLMGIVDLVREGGRIVDFKTAAKSPTQGTAAHTHGTQLGVYAILYRHCTGEKEGGLELHHLIKTKTPKVVVTEMNTIPDQVVSNTMELMHRYVDAVKAGDFTSSPSFMCGSCEYFAACQQWKGAA